MKATIVRRFVTRRHAAPRFAPHRSTRRIAAQRAAALGKAPGSQTFPKRS